MNSPFEISNEKCESTKLLFFLMEFILLAIEGGWIVVVGFEVTQPCFQLANDSFQVTLFSHQ